MEFPRPNTYPCAKLEESVGRTLQMTRRVLHDSAYLSTSTRHELNRRMSGIFFEDVTYNFLKSTVSPHEVVTSPDATLEVFELLTGKDAVSEFGLRRGIMGVHVPDGILFSKNEEGVFTPSFLTEYKLNPNRSHNFEDQMNSFDKTRCLFNLAKNRSIRNSVENVLRKEGVGRVDLHPENLHVMRVYTPDDFTFDYDKLPRFVSHMHVPFSYRDLLARFNSVILPADVKKRKPAFYL